MGRVEGSPPPVPDTGLKAAYQAYFLSGHYDRRYPRPNLTTWRRILAALPEKAHVLDFGCGNGRYLLPLRPHVARAAGYDISPAAIALLRERATALGWRDLAILGPDPNDLPAYVARSGSVDVVLCLFGVLAHIADPVERHGALGQMKAALAPGDGRLILSVPNRARRFRKEQRAAGPAADGLIEYERHLGHTHLLLPYQLYDPARLRRELAAAGFRLTSMRAESVLPESWLLNHRLARWVDRALTPLCPAAWGYGILAEARA